MTKGLLSDTDRIEVVRYRLEKANRTYKEAVGSIKNGYVKLQLTAYITQHTMPFLHCLFLTNMKQVLIMV